MKGVILAGGTASRLHPLTKVTNKHLLPVYNKPMIYYPIESLVKAGIKEIMIVSGKGHAGGFLELLGSGEKFGAQISYAVQEEAGGIAQALGLTEKFVDNDKVVVYLGDNILQDDINSAVDEFKKVTMGSRIFLKQVDNPSSYGVAEVKNDVIVNIIEKPQKFISNLAVIGVYMYDNQVWDVIKTLKPSGRGELEITDVNNFYIQQGTMKYDILKGWWGDCGESIDTWLAANNLVAQHESGKIMTESSYQLVKNTTQEVIKEALKILKEETPKIVREELKAHAKKNISKNKKVFPVENPNQDKLLESIAQDEDKYTNTPFDINNYYSK
ncbi:NTP transferase domain-containing protein [bacterium]|nr:NTP transferase domain-containing protein [bacterium]